MASPLHFRPLPPPAVTGFDFSDLDARIIQLSNREHPTKAERENLWLASCFLLREHAAAGRDIVQAKREIINRLWTFGVRLAQTEAANLHNLDRKFQRFTASGKVADRRIEANRARCAPKLSKEDRITLIKTAVYRCGGFVDFAWQTCLKENLLSAELIARHPAPKNHPARCPKNVRMQISPAIKQLYQYHVRPHHYANNVAPMVRDWDNVSAQDVYECDDKTLDVTCRVGKEENPKVTESFCRCQFMLMDDQKSEKALEFVLIAEANYNSKSIKRLFKKTFRKYGLPRKLQLENGMWKTAKLLGNNAANKLREEVENFGTHCGVQIGHALPGRSRTKIVELVFHQLDRKMYGVTGYIGSDEKTVKFERVKDAQLYTLEEWIVLLEKIVEDYNNTPRNIHGEFLTPNQAWEKNRRRNANGEIEPVPFLTPEFAYLLDAPPIHATVRPYGVQFKLAGESYRYHSDQLIDFQSNLFGQTVKVWFDPDASETAVVTDFKEQLYIPCVRVPKSPAFIQTEEDRMQFVKAGHPYRAFMRQVREHYSDLKPAYLAPHRPIVADVIARERARKIGDASKQARQLSSRIENTNFAESVALSAERRQQSIRELEEFERQNPTIFQ